MDNSFANKQQYLGFPYLIGCAVCQGKYGAGRVSLLLTERWESCKIYLSLVKDVIGAE